MIARPLLAVPHGQGKAELFNSERAMNSKFDLGGYVLEITDSGHLTSEDGMQGAASKGQVGLQLARYPLSGPSPDTPPKQTTVFQGFVKPSQARAIASALLSAATEAREK